MGAMATAALSAAVEAPLIFLEPQPERPVIYLSEPPPGVAMRTGSYAPQLVAIQDARPIADHLSLDVEGFRLIHASTACTDFADDALIRSLYYPEVERLI